MVGFTIRRMMIAVAIVGVACGASVLRGRYLSYRERARHYGLLEQVMMYGGIETQVDEDSAWRYGRLRVKYEGASRFPWMCVAPDPPEEIRRQKRVQDFLVWYRAQKHRAVGQLARDPLEAK